MNMCDELREIIKSERRALKEMQDHRNTENEDAIKIQRGRLYGLGLAESVVKNHEIRSNIRTKTLFVGGDVAQKIAAKMVECSQWFSVDPMPDGVYEFSVKVEFMPMFEEIVTAVKAC